MLCNMGCRLYGAHRVAISVKDSVVVFHSPVCCDYATLPALSPSRQNDLRQCCTNMIESDAINGGERVLRASLERVMETFDYSVLFLISSCVPELIGDDCAQILDEALADSASPNARKPHYLLEAPGFKGSEWEGTLDAMSRLVSSMEPAPIRPSSINLVGFFESDYKVDGDLNLIARMLDKTTVNAVFPYDIYDRVMSLPAAQLNVVLRGFESVGELLKEKFGTPFLVADYPYGLNLSRAFCESIYQALGICDFTEIDRQESESLRKLANARRYIEQLHMMPAAIVGYPARVHSLSTLLSKELGMVVSVAVDRTAHKQEGLFSAIEGSAAAVMFGCDYEASISSRLNIPFFAFDYPTFRKISISENGYAGFSGYVNLVEDIVNTLMEKNFSWDGSKGV